MTIRPLVLAAVLALSFTSSGCDPSAYEAEVAELAAGFQRPNYVDYADEGRIFVVDNRCARWPEDDPERPVAPDCPSPFDEAPRFEGAVEGCPITYFPPRLDDSGLFDEPACGVREVTDMEEAQRLLRIHRWIDVNPSFNGVESAQTVALSKLIDRYGLHEEGDPVRALLLVYLPMGPELGRVDWEADPDTVLEQRTDELLRTMCGKYPVEHPTFEERLGSLIDGVTDLDDSVVVTSSSYSAHQVMNVVRDRDNVFWYDINPTFGAFVGDGSPGYDELCVMGECEDSVLDGYTERYSCSPNPLIFDWLYDLEHSTVTQCLLASRGDCVSQYAFGVGLSFQAGDPAELLTHENSCAYPEQMQHDWIIPVDADAATTFDLWGDPNKSEDRVLDAQTSTAWVGPGGTSLLWYSAEVFSTIDTPGGAMPLYGPEMRWSYWSPERTHDALWANLNERPGNTKIQLVQASGTGDDCSDTDNTRRDCSESERARTADADHFEFYDIGVPIGGPDGHGPYNFMWDEFEACPGLWDPTDCPECRVADGIAQGTHADDDLVFSYVDPGHGTRVLPANRMRHRDVIYLPPAGVTYVRPQMLDELQLLDSIFDGPLTPNRDEQFHIAATPSRVDLRADVYPADDLQHDDEVLSVHLEVDDATWSVFDGAPHTARRQLTYDADWPTDALTSPSGRYHDLAGAWFDVGGGYTSLDPCDPQQATDEGKADVLRVLVMRSEVDPGDQLQRLYPAPVPDVIDFAPPPTVDSTSIVPLTMGAFTLLDEVPAVTITPRGTDTPGAVAFEATPAGPPRETSMGDTHTYFAWWDVLETWCDAYPADGAMCGGTLAESPPETLLVTLRVEASNSEGNSFWVEREVLVLRGEDVYAYTCAGSCGDMSPSGCWCDEWCSWFGDCCPDVTEVCGLPYACDGRSWCP